MLLQNLPTVQIPTLDQLYRAVVIAAVAALSLLLNGGSSGGGSTGFTVKVGVGGTITVPKVAVTAILVFALVLLQNLPAMAIPTATDLYKGLVIAAITALGLVLNGGGNASGGSAGRSDIPI